MIGLFERYERIRVINLDHRRDRRREMLRELQRAGLSDDRRVAFFSACQFDDRGQFSSIGARGVFASHLALLDAASAAGESLLVLEDDCDFEADARDRIVSTDSDIIYGGHYAADPDNIDASDIAGAHMMGFSARVIPALCRFLTDMTAEADGVRQPIDAAYVSFRRAHPEWRTEFCIPPVGIQRPSRTDIADNAFYDRLPILRDAVELVRRAKRLWYRHRF